MAGAYVTPTDKAVPCLWVVERDAEEQVPMLINASDCDAAIHVAIDEDGKPIGEPKTRGKK